MAGRIVGSFDDLIADLQQQAGWASKTVNDAMQDAMQTVCTEAKARVPFEYGNAEDAIFLAKDNLRKRWYVSIDDSYPDNTGKYTVGDYIVFLHESIYRLGERSLAKAAANGKPVGRKFLEGPFQEAIDAGLIANLQRLLNESLANRRR
jgi:hypothetical protein